MKPGVRAMVSLDGREGKARMLARRAGRGSDLLEQLESRVLLAASNLLDLGTEGPVTWHGHTIQAIRGSWVLTFDSAIGKAEATARAQQVAADLGVTPTRIKASVRGRFAEFLTTDDVQEARVIETVARFGFLAQVEPNATYGRTLVPNDPQFPAQWGHENTGQNLPQSGPGLIGADISLVEAWNITTGSDRVVIAVLDTGVDINHPDIRANIWTNPGEIPGNEIDDDGNGFIDDVNGWDFASEDEDGQDNDPSDPVTQGHGTAVAGVIGAVGGNNLGIAGVAWNISILPLKIFPEEGNANTFDIINAYDYCVNLIRNSGVRIVASNNSYGALRPGEFDVFDTAQETAIQDFTEAGALFIAAAGNDGVDNDSSLAAFPASYPNPDIIAVAASNNQDRLAGFSNYGRISVDVAAPGVEVRTLEVGGGYQYIDGTSFAAPYTAGVIGLMAAANPYADSQQLKQALLSTVDVLPQFEDRVLTGGRINAFRAVSEILIRGPVVAAIEPGPQTAPVDQITVQFSKPINSMFFASSGISLRQANGDGRFDGDDIFFTFAPEDVALTGNRLVITLPVLLGIDDYRLTLTASNFRDSDGNYLNGFVGIGNNEVYDFSVVAFSGTLEPNDSITLATPVLLDENGAAMFVGLFIGDGANGLADVDMFKVYVDGPALISASVLAASGIPPSGADTLLRIFDASGVELTSNDNFNGLDPSAQYFVSGAGNYYIGVSAFPNRSYDPNLTNMASRVPGDTSGQYSLSIKTDLARTETINYFGAGPVPIPSIGVITSTIFITDVRSIADINVELDITHAHVGDLLITLTGPQGQVVRLIDRRGGSGTTFGATILDDAAFQPISAGMGTFTGRFRPEDPLGVFNDTSGAGIWTLTITDSVPGDAGTLLGWSMEVQVANDVFGPLELNDTGILATDAQINGTGSRTFNAFLGDGAFGLRDVDVFRFVAGAGATITASSIPVGPTLDTVLRLFDSTGRELAVDKAKGTRTGNISFIVVDAGVYYIGVSIGNVSDPDPQAVGNADYDLFVAGSGSPGESGGAYSVVISVVGGISDPATILRGQFIALGLDPDGSLGIRSGAGRLGLTFSGIDFIAPESQPEFAGESFYGATYNGFSFRNAGAGVQTALPMLLSNESDFLNRRVSVIGQFRDLAVKRTVTFGNGDKFIAIDVTLTNATTDNIEDVAWMEGFDPSQGIDLAQIDGRSINNVDNATGRLVTARVSTPAFPGGLTVALAGVAPAEGSVIGSVEALNSIRDPFQIINSPVDPDTSPGDVGAVGDRLITLGYNLGTLAPTASVSFRYFILLGDSEADVTALFTQIESGTGQGHLVPVPTDLGIAPTTLPYAAYYPEGFANDRASTFVTIVNPNREATRVVVIARYEGTLAPQVIADRVVDGGKRTGVTITDPALYARDAQLVAKNTPYAVEIRSSSPIGATLAHYDFGVATGEAFTSTTSTVWTFGEGFKGSGVFDFLVFYNPGDTAVKVTMTIFPERDGAEVVQLSRTVQAGRRGGFNFSQIPQLADGPFGVRLDAEQPIVAALSHYDTNIGGGFGIIGLPSAGSLTGATPEGSFGLRSPAEFVTILNTNTADATVTLTFTFANGSAYRFTTTVDARSRGGVSVGQLPQFPAGPAYSVSYDSDRPVTVMLPSYALGEAFGTLATATASTLWLFSDGFRPLTPGQVTEYLRLYNPTTSPLTAEITLDFNDGSSETFRRTLTARAANEFNVHDFVTGTRATVGTVPGVGSFYGIRIKTAAPIVAYMGRFDGFFGSGFGTLGTPLGATGSV